MQRRRPRHRRLHEAYVLDTRGHILEALGRKEEAIANYHQALSKDPFIEKSKEGLKRLGASP